MNISTDSSCIHKYICQLGPNHYTLYARNGLRVTGQAERPWRWYTYTSTKHKQNRLRKTSTTTTDSMFFSTSPPPWILRRAAAVKPYYNAGIVLELGQAYLAIDWTPRWHPALSYGALTLHNGRWNSSTEKATIKNTKSVFVNLEVQAWRQCYWWNTQNWPPCHNQLRLSFQ